jgi:hypothetical protein
MQNSIRWQTISQLTPLDGDVADILGPRAQRQLLIFLIGDEEIIAFTDVESEFQIEKNAFDTEAAFGIGSDRPMRDVDGAPLTDPG